jgi:gliding motility-associated lipoprotein GldH
MTKRIFRTTLPLLLITSAILASCNKNVVYTESTDMPGKKWELMNVSSFKVPVSDTLSSNNLMFTIRTSASYPFRNIFLFVKTTSPEGKIVTDTLEYFLSDEKGHWYGKGFGDIHELRLPYKSNVYFPKKGIYVFNIRHGMRVEDLEGVYDFGLRIEKNSR